MSLTLACSDDQDDTQIDAGSDASVIDAGHTPPDSDSGRQDDASTAADDAGDDDDGGATQCALSSVLRFGQVGGFVQTQIVAQLDKAGVLSITRSGGSQDDVTCMPTVPACGAKQVGVDDITRDLDDAEVKAAFALAEAPFYGQVRPDAGTFHIDRDDGKSLDVAGECLVDDFDSGVSCEEAPSGIARLVRDLRAMEQAGLAQQACATL